MTMDPTPGITAHLKGNNVFEWEVTIQGPLGTTYEGRTFLLNTF